MFGAAIKNFRQGTAERDETSGLYVDRAGSLATGSRTCSVPTSELPPGHRRARRVFWAVRRPAVDLEPHRVDPAGRRYCRAAQIAQNYTQQQSFQDRVPDLSPPNPATDQSGRADGLHRPPHHPQRGRTGCGQSCHVRVVTRRAIWKALAQQTGARASRGGGRRRRRCRRRPASRRVVSRRSPPRTTCLGRSPRRRGARCR